MKEIPDAARLQKIQAHLVREAKKDGDANAVPKAKKRLKAMVNERAENKKIRLEKNKKEEESSAAVYHGLTPDTEKAEDPKFQRVGEELKNRAQKKFGKDFFQLPTHQKLAVMEDVVGEVQEGTPEARLKSGIQQLQALLQQEPSPQVLQRIRRTFADVIPAHYAYLDNEILQTLSMNVSNLVFEHVISSDTDLQTNKPLKELYGVRTDVDVNDVALDLKAVHVGQEVRPGDSWIDKDAQGNSIPTPQGQKYDRLNEILNEIRSAGGSASPSLLDSYYRQILDLPRAPDGQIDKDIVPYVKRMKEVYYALFGERHQLSPEEFAKIEHDPENRDDEFYKRLKKLLERQEDESRHIMGLYEQADMDAFLHAVGQIKDRQEQRIGAELARRYDVRLQAIERFHDIDYWARHPSGEIKSYAGTVAQIQNYHVKEALSDPYVEIMRNCLEKALLFIRTTNNGYIPPNLVTPDPIRGGKIFWDELALKFFREKVEAKQVFDVQRYPSTGLPERDDRFGGNVYRLRNDHVGIADLDKQELRVLATIQIAKGILALDERTLEIIGMSKVPGFDHAEFGIEEPGFSSKAYGQLARWFNPMAEWMGKYKMGTTLHVPFFQTLIEGRPSWIEWSSDQWRKAMEAVMDGRLEEVFGLKAKRFLDMAEEMSFSGRWGPMSQWGTKDATIGWSDRDKERLGGSMRMVFAKDWAEEKIKKMFEKQNPNKPESWIYSQWERVKGNKEWKDRIDNLTKTKRTWLWTQLTMRHPTIVAGYLKEEVVIEGKRESRPIRDRIIKEILEINLEDYYKNSNRTPSDAQRDRLMRIAELEGDMDTVQQKAMNIKDGTPRNIEDPDFNIITNEDRMKRAKAYWEKVKKAVLGDWSFDQWHTAIGKTEVIVKDKPVAIWFQNYMDIDSVFVNALNATQGNPPLLNKELAGRAIAMQHISTEDVQWRFLDIDTLGPPHWNRRAGDLGARIEAIQKEIAFLDMLTANPDRRKLAEKLNEVFLAEKSHDPGQAHKFMYLFALATGDLYRQDHWGKVPILGKVGPMVVPSSIAQKFFETTKAAAWSANNEREWTDQFSDGRTLPLKEYYGGKHFGPYNAHHLAKELGATRAMQITEMIIIGAGLATIATSIYALTKSVEDETKQ